MSAALDLFYGNFVQPARKTHQHPGGDCACLPGDNANVSMLQKDSLYPVKQSFDGSMSGRLTGLILNEDIPYKQKAGEGTRVGDSTGRLCRRPP